MTTRCVLLVALLLLVRAGHPAAQTPLTIGEMFTLDSKVMGEPRKVLVWTPGDAANGRAYPVLYLTDAERQFGHTVTTVEFLSRNGRIPPMIVVGVFNTDRTRDLTPYRDKDDETTGQMATAGGADRFLKFMETELIPWVESRYRTQTFRAFAGHSFGGLFGIARSRDTARAFRRDRCGQPFPALASRRAGQARRDDAGKPAQPDVQPLRHARRRGSGDADRLRPASHGTRGWRRQVDALEPRPDAGRRPRLDRPAQPLPGTRACLRRLAPPSEIRRHVLRRTARR